MNPLRGILLKLLSVAVFFAMSVVIKATAAEVPPGEAAFFRSFFALPLLIGWLAWRGEFPAALRTDNLMGHFWRSVVGVMAMGSGFLALGLLPLPEVVALGYAAPLLATIFAAMFLGEEVRGTRLAAVALGLIGVGLILAPRLTLLDPAAASKLQTIGAFAALNGAVFAALATVFIRKLVQTEGTGAIVFYFSGIAAALSLLTIPFGWVVPTPATAALLVLAGVLGGLGQILMTASYRHAETAVIAPFDYASMLFALAVGYFAFQEVPTASMIGGSGLVILAGLLIIWRERKLGIRRARARKALTPEG